MHRNFLRSAALAATLPLGFASAQGLAAVGPVNPDHGFPEWYEDANGLRLAPCLEDVTLCGLEGGPVDLVNPGAPFPDNYGGTFADHVLYGVAEAEMESANGGLALLVITVQGAFINELELPVDGEQDVFARFRVRVDNLIQGQTYDVTTPFGVFSFVAENSERRGINFTDDVGRGNPGVFDGALGGLMGPWLMWDSELPLTDADGNEYLGNPAVPHTITGSPFGTNIFRIDGPSVGGPGINRIETDLFSVIGLVAPDGGDPPPPPPPPPAPELTMSAPTPGIAGRPNTFGVEGASANGQVVYVLGTLPGDILVAPGPCTTGFSIGMLDPRVIGSAFADADGAAAMTRTVPPGVGGFPFLLQAVDVTGCASSNVVTHSF